MHCAINYSSGVSLWVNDNCTDYEIRDGIGNLDKSSRLLTKACILGKLNTSMCNNEYETFIKGIKIGVEDYVYINSRFMYDSNLRITFTIKFGNEVFSVDYIAPPELLIFHYFKSDKAFYSNKVILFFLDRFLKEWSEEYDITIPEHWENHITVLQDKYWL